MVRSMQALGHQVPFDEPVAPVQISFSNPYNYKFHKGQYRIGYSPWESTTVPEPWLRKMNKCDEIWATSGWVANVYEQAGVKVPIKVYEHGIDPRWQPVSRQPGEKVKFLHVGEPALRKGGQLAIDAFREAFGDRDDVHLTMKCYYQTHTRAYGDDAFVHADGAYNNVSFIKDNVNFADLQAIYHDHDVMVYPSYGEGFGLIPLQALATGMPVICTQDWAPYQRFLSPLNLPARKDRSIWSIHPGDVYYPNYDALVDLYRYSATDLTYLRNKFEKQAPAIHERFDWSVLTRNAVQPLVERFTDN